MLIVNDLSVVILAAGRGTRLGEFGIQIPKALIRTGKDSETMISRLIDQFSTISKDVRVVMGHRTDLLHPYLLTNYPDVVRTYNEYYQDKSNMVSLQVGTSSLSDKCRKLVIVDADTYLSEQAFDLIRRMVIKSENGIIFTTKAKRPDGEWSVATDNLHRITNISTEPQDGDAVTSGVTFFANDSLRHLLSKLDTDGEYNYWDDIYLSDYQEMQLLSFELPGFVGEIDNLEDIATIVGRRAL